MLPEASYQFRRDLLNRLDRWTPIERFAYIDSDTMAMVCPVCDGPLIVVFHGMAPRADLVCDRGCTEGEVLAALSDREAA